MYAELFKLKTDYFNSAFLGPTPLRTQVAVSAFLEKSLDPSQLSDQFNLDEELRLRWSRLIGTSIDNIAVSTSVSELVSHVVNGMSLTADDEIVLMKGEYPSMVLPWMVNAELKGFQLRFLELEDFLDPARFARQLQSHTRYAACSQVLFNSGTQLPIAELGRAARNAGVLFLADTSQSFGGMTLKPDILTNVDILVGVGYKWILGPYGSAYGYFSPAAQAQLHRTHASWLGMPGARSRENLLNYTTTCVPGARKFDRGEPASYLICTALISSLDLLTEIGLDKIEKHNADLRKTFLNGVSGKFELVGHPEHPSNIICLRVPDAAGMRQRLAQEKIEVSLREGTLRFSFHFFNDHKQVERLLGALA